MDTRYLRGGGSSSTLIRDSSSRRSPVDKFRSRFEKFVSAHPVWVVYLRAMHHYRCPVCYAEAARSADPQCTECWGMGYRWIAHKMAVRLWDGKSLIDSEEDLSAGTISEYEGVFAMKRAYYPAVGDLILEVQWDAPTRSIQTAGKPIGVDRAYRVEAVRPRRLGGSVVYHIAYCKSYEFESAWLSEELRRRGNIYATVATAARVPKLITDLWDLDLYGGVEPSAQGWYDDQWELDSDGNLTPRV